MFLCCTCCSNTQNCFGRMIHLSFEFRAWFQVHKRRGCRLLSCAFLQRDRSHSSYIHYTLVFEDSFDRADQCISTLLQYTYTMRLASCPRTYRIGDRPRNNTWRLLPYFFRLLFWVHSFLKCRRPLFFRPVDTLNCFPMRIQWHFGNCQKVVILQFGYALRVLK